MQFTYREFQEPIELVAKGKGRREVEKAVGIERSPKQEKGREGGTPYRH
jgi:hypothetical protein